MENPPEMDDPRDVDPPEAEDPPEVTVGDDALTVGVEDEPAVPLDEAMPPDEVADDPPLTTVADPEVETAPDEPVAVVPALLLVLLDPVCPWDTAIPMATVAPVAARTAPRVRLRSRARAFSLFSGVCG